MKFFNSDCPMKLLSRGIITAYIFVYKYMLLICFKDKD